MHRCLRQCLRDDGRLAELDAETEVDKGMQEPGEESDEHVVGAEIPFEERLVEDGFPSLGGDFLAEEVQEVGVVFSFSEVSSELLGVVHGGYDGFVWSGEMALVGEVVGVGLFDFWVGGVEGVEGEEVVGDVVLVDVSWELFWEGEEETLAYVEAIGVEEDVVLVVVLLQELAREFHGLLSRPFHVVLWR